MNQMLLDRLYDEFNELDKKLIKLTQFLDEMNEASIDLIGFEQLELLEEQEEYMQHYLYTLGKRIIYIERVIGLDSEEEEF